MLLIITIVLELFLYFDEDSIISYMQSTLSNTNVLGERNKLSIKEIFFYIKLLILLSFFDIVLIFFLIVKLGDLILASFYRNNLLEDREDKLSRLIWKRDYNWIKLRIITISMISKMIKFVWK